MFFLLMIMFGGVFFVALIAGMCMGGEEELKTSEMSGFILDPNSVSKKDKKENLDIEEII